MRGESLESSIKFTNSNLFSLISRVFFLIYHLKLLMTIGYPITNGYPVNLYTQVTLFGLIL